MSLIVADGADYSRTGNTITPVTNFTGTLTVPVRVTDGIDTSATFDASVTVTNINDAPVITAQIATYNINEETAFTIHLTDIAVADPDNTWPDEFTLIVFDSTNYSVSNDSLVTPDSEFSGTLSIPVQVSDGSLTSNIFMLTDTILAIYDPPVLPVRLH
jgi:hypothetical protein